MWTYRISRVRAFLLNDRYRRATPPTLDVVIRRQFDSVEGDPFNPRENLVKAPSVIRALGYFEGAEVNAREGSFPPNRSLSM